MTLDGRIQKAETYGTSRTARIPRDRFKKNLIILQDTLIALSIRLIDLRYRRYIHITATIQAIEPPIFGIDAVKDELRREREMHQCSWHEPLSRLPQPQWPSVAT